MSTKTSYKNSQTVKYVTVPQVLAIHDRAVKRFGGSSGVRDLAGLESAVAQPQASAFGEDLYVGIYIKAAALLRSIALNHPFIDGNKRTAYMSAGIFLQLNGHHFENRGDEAVEFMVRVVEEKLSVEKIAEWMEGEKTEDRSQKS